MNKAAKAKDAWVIFLLISILALFYSPVFKNINNGFSSDDWYEKYCFLASARNTILHYHQFPFRSPLIDGGYPTVGHPYDDSLNPLFIFPLVLGENVGIRVMVFLLFMLGALGMFYLTRYVLGYNMPASFFSSSTFALCSYGACQFTEGNMERLYLYLAPWLMAFFIKSIKDPRFIVASALVLSVFIIKGVTAVSAIVFLSLLAFLYAVEHDGKKIRLRARPLILLCAIIGFSVALCAPKIFSAIGLLASKRQFIHFPFEDSYAAISRFSVDQGRVLSIKRLFESLLVKNSYLNAAGDFSQMYLGFIPVGLFFASILLFWKKSLRFVIILLVFMILASGSHSPIDLFKLLWLSHPFVHAIWKLDETFFLYIVLFISLISGSAFMLLSGPGKTGRVYRYSAVLLISLNIGTMFGANQRFLLHPDVGLKSEQFGQQLPFMARAPSFYQVKFNYPEKSKEDYFYLKANVGLVDFHQDLLIRIGNFTIPKFFVDREDFMYLPRLDKKARLNPAYRGEAFFTNAQNHLEISYFSPHEIRIAVAVDNPGLLVINQNYHKDWRVDRGPVISHEGLLAVSLQEKGRYQVVFRYVPVTFYAGCLVSCIALVSFVLILRSKESFKDKSGVPC